MTKQIITLSDNAANRIKEIMSAAEKNSLGVRVGVKSGGCAGMSYIMEYTNEINPSDEDFEWTEYTATVILPPGSAPGTWGITELTLRDRALNFKTYNFTEIVSAPAITWAFVTMRPSALIKNPEPIPMPGALLLGECS